MKPATVTGTFPQFDHAYAYGRGTARVVAIKFDNLAATAARLPVLEELGNAHFVIRADWSAVPNNPLHRNILAEGYAAVVNS